MYPHYRHDEFVDVTNEIWTAMYLSLIHIWIISQEPHQLKTTFVFAFSNIFYFVLLLSFHSCSDTSAK